MFVLTINGYPKVCSEDSNKLEEIINNEIEQILNNPKYDEQRYTNNEVWYYNGIIHCHYIYDIKLIKVI